MDGVITKNNSGELVLEGKCTRREGSALSHSSMLANIKQFFDYISSVIKR